MDVTSVDKYDVTGRPVISACFQATAVQLKRDIRTFLGSAEPSGFRGRIQENVTEKLHIQYSIVLDYSPKEISSSSRWTRPFTFQSPTQTKTNIIRITSAYNQICIYAAVCVWFDQNNENKEAGHRQVPELSEVDLAILTYHKDGTTSGDRMLVSRGTQCIAQVSQDAGDSAQGGKGQYCVTRPSIKSEGTWTLVWRDHTLPRSNPDSKFVCAL